MALRKRASVVVLALVFAAACSGGTGTGSGTGSGTAGAGLSLSTSEVDFSTTYGDPPPAAKTVDVTVTATDAAALAVGYPPGVTSPSWLSVKLTGAGATWHLALSVGASSQAGTFSTTVRVAAVRADGSVVGYQDVKVTYAITAGLATSVAHTPLTFLQSIGSSAAPPTQTLVVNGTVGMTWTAATDQPWLTLSATSGGVPATITVSADGRTLPGGTYPAHITVSGGPTPRTVDVVLTVAPPILYVYPYDTFTVTSGTAGGSVLQAGSFQISLSTGANAYPWTASGVPSWLQLGGPTSGNLSSTSVLFDPRWDPSGLSPGTYTATVQLSADVNGLTVTHDLQFSFTASAPTVTATPSAVTLGGASAHDLSSKIVNVSLPTVSSGFAFTAAGDDLVTVSPASGTLSSTAVPLTVAPTAAASKLPAGTYTGAATVTVDVNGSPVTKSIPVTLTLDDHKLLVSADGVAFTSTPGLSGLTRTLHVRSNRGVTESWSASSDQSWLTATASGTTADALVLTADPTGLAKDSLYQGTVTVTSSDAAVANTEAIRVGLWVGSSTPSSPVAIATSYSEVVADPVRPYAYVHSGGSSITVYDVHTGASLATISGVGAALGAMAVATDGSRLFVVDNDTAGRKIAPVDLATRAVGSAWPIGAAAPASLTYARANGVGVVVASDGSIRNASSGASYTGTATAGSLLTASRDGSRLCVMKSPSDYLYCAVLDLGPGGVLVGTPSQTYVGSGVSDLALNLDGTRVYLAAGWGWSVFPSFDTSTITLSLSRGTNLPYSSVGSTASPGAVDVGADGRIYGGSIAASTPDTWVWIADGTSKGTFDLAGTSKRILPRQLAVAGDALRFVVLTGDPTLQFVTAP